MTNIASKLSEIRERFANQLPVHLSEIDAALDAVVGQACALADLVFLQSKAHRLAGLAGTLGYHGLSEAARCLERHVGNLAAHATDRLPTQSTEPLTAMVRALRDVTTRGLLETETAHTTTPSLSAKGPVPSSVFVLRPDDGCAHDTDCHLRDHGYEVHRIDSVESMRQALEKHRPSAIIADMACIADLLESRTQGEMQDAPESDIPLVLLSARNDFSMRLLAIRARASAFLTLPLDFDALLGELEQHSGRGDERPERVLVVDDDADVAEFHCTVLNDANMEAISVNDPTTVLDRMTDFQPDLILTDYHMPQCNGAELAAIIRQQENLSGIPVVYLSAEEKASVISHAIDAGGDDFLHTPVSPDRLVKAVRARVGRTRRLRALMTRDGLTGLLNHAAIMERLDIELARAARDGTTVAVALLDLDHFKSINDRFGHLRGDQVLRALGRALRDRFRRTDVLGRYGGEEFLVVLPNTSPQIAEKLVDDVRSAFAAQRHTSEQGAFQVTFSCGISSFPFCGGRDLLMEAADAALYKAKLSGRNRVLVHAAP